MCIQILVLEADIIILTKQILLQIAAKISLSKVLLVLDPASTPPAIHIQSEKVVTLKTKKVAQAAAIRQNRQRDTTRAELAAVHRRVLKQVHTNIICTSTTSSRHRVTHSTIKIIMSNTIIFEVSFLE